jgi:prefoldin subunit 5
MARRIIGITFIVAAIFGLIFSLTGAVFVWVVKEPITQNLISTLDLIDTTLEATSTGLTVADDTLTQAITDFGTLESTIQTASKTLEDSVPMVETLSNLTSESLPGAIEATQTGLNTVQDAARSIESTLRLITSIPFIPIESYDPEVSFTEALDDVTTSLEPIPDALLAMEDTLNTTKGNLVLIAAQVRIISRNIGELRESLYQMQLVIGQYQGVITTLQDRVEAFRINLATIINVSAWLFTIIFIWLGIAQLGLLTQGLERVNWPASQEEEDEGAQLTVAEQVEEDDLQQDAEAIDEKE